MTIKPAPDYLFCKIESAENKTKSGILVPSNVEVETICEVINIGSNVKEYESRDKIIYKSYSTTEVNLEDKKYVMIHQKDVLGVIV